MTRRPLGICLATVLTCVAYGAMAMSVQDALVKARALQKKGMVLAALSPDFPAVKRNVLDAGKVWRAQETRAKPPVCAPPSVSFTTQDAISFLERVPETRRPPPDAQTAIVEGLDDRYRGP